MVSPGDFSLLRLRPPGADSGFEKGGGAGGSGASFWSYLGQFRGLFKEFGAKTGGRVPPPLWIRACPRPHTDSSQLAAKVMKK